MMEDTLQDLRFAFRGWRRAPGFTIAAIATLGLGIGANTAIFSVVSGVLLRPLPFANPDRLVLINETQPRDGTQGGFQNVVVYGDFEEWRAGSKLFESMLHYSTSSRNFQGDGEPQQIGTVSAERGFFRLLGVSAVSGRTFREGDPLNVAVASYSFWKTHLGGDPAAIGRTVKLDGVPFTLLGVMPAGFQFPIRPVPADLWVAWEANAELRAHPNWRLDAVIGRLRPAVAMEAARQELAAMRSTQQGKRIVRLDRLRDVVTEPARKSLLVLLGAVGMVLLVACANVANLLLARVASRGREIAIRAALGASKWRLTQQFLTESLLLAAGGGALGLALGVLGSRILLRAAAAQIPRSGEIGVDWRVFGFLLAVCVATGIAFGLAPALGAARGTAALKTRSVRSKLRDGLVIAEVALAFVLLTGAGLLLRTFLRLQDTNPGLNAENVLTVHIVVTGGPESAAIAERVQQIPGVRAAGVISLLPLQNSGWGAFFTIEGRTDLLATELRYVTPGYFRAMGIPLRRGREFSGSELPKAPISILVNETLARRYYPNQDPVGRKTSRGTIIGVVGDVRQESLSEPAKPEIYYTMVQNFAQLRRVGSTLVVRIEGSPEGLTSMVRAAIREVSPDQALFQVATMERVVHESLATPRLYTWLLGLFAGMSTLLAVAGIYGVVAYLVSLRTQEFGIRMALGADTARVLLLVMRHGAMLVAIGLACGIAGAAAVTRVLRGVLYGVAPTDPATFAAMAAVLALAAMAACLVPARRAARVDPAVALRRD